MESMKTKMNIEFSNEVRRSPAEAKQTVQGDVVSALVLP